MVVIELNSSYIPSIIAWLLAGAVDIAQIGNNSLTGSWNIAHASIEGVRACMFLAGAFYACFNLHRHVIDTSEEAQSLLANSADSAPDYGAVPETTSKDDEDDEEDEDEKEIRKLREQRIQGGVLAYIKGFTMFLPYIFPFKDHYTQFWYFIMFLTIAAERVLTLAIPRQLGIVVDALTRSHGTGTLPLKELLIYAGLQFPVSTTVDILQSFASTRMSQYSHYQLNSLAFAHVMNLSMDYHTGKSTGKVTKAIELGTNLSSLIDTVITAGPMVLDLAIAVIYLTRTFDASMGYIVLVTSLLSIYIALKTNQFTADIERGTIEKSRVENTVLYDTISNWYTVALHNRARYETDRYMKAVKASLLANRKYYDVSELAFMFEKVVMDFGLFAAAYVAASRSVDGIAAVSSFVFLLTYWGSVTSPISALAWMYHSALEKLISAEWLYQLLQTKPSVEEKPNAAPLSITTGKVEFSDVCFSYTPDRQILKNVSFTVQPGQSIAFVGETGSGKSTLLKLLWRFYDVTSGSITIDDQDLRDVTLDSLRDSLGAVPQDPSVFDTTIIENLLYAREGATEDQAHAACKAARIHDQIMSFPAGYRSRIGERGVRLSGGELQRLAIARVILRDPKIVILDEATSAVDSDTEASVQLAIRELSKGRTVFTVAHRLSTVIGADQIVVVDGGRVVEVGGHGELLALGGKYARLWGMQTGTLQAGGSQTGSLL